MASNPLAGLSRYINVEYDEPETNVVDSIFGTYAQRMDRDIAKANVSLERDRLRYNADLAQTQQQQKRIDTARRDLNSNKIALRAATKGEPAWYIDELSNKIDLSYAEILGQEDIDAINLRVNPAEAGKGDGYVDKSKSNWSSIKALNSNKDFTAQELVNAAARFNYDADQGAQFNQSISAAAKKTIVSDGPTNELWLTAGGENLDNIALYTKTLSQKKNFEMMLGRHESQEGINFEAINDDGQPTFAEFGGQNITNARNAILKMVTLEQGPQASGTKFTQEEWNSMTMNQKLDLSNEAKDIETATAKLKDITGKVQRYERYKKEPWLFIKENTKLEPDVLGNFPGSDLSVIKAVQEINPDLKFDLSKLITGITTEDSTEVLDVFTSTDADSTTTATPDSTTLTEEQINQREELTKKLEAFEFNPAANQSVVNADSVVEYGSREELMSGIFPNTSDTTEVAQPDSMVTEVAQPDSIMTYDTSPSTNLLSPEKVEIQSGVYPSPKQMFDIMSIAESSGDPDSTRVNDNGTLDAGAVQINSSNVLEPGNEFGGKSNMIIPEGLPGAGEPDPLWAKAQAMFKEEFGPDWDKIDDAGKMEFVKNMTVQKKFFNIWYPVRPTDFRALPRAMKMYNEKKPLSNIASSKEDMISSQLDSLGLTANATYDLDAASVGD